MSANVNHNTMENIVNKVIPPIIIISYSLSSLYESFTEEFQILQWI